MSIIRSFFICVSMYSIIPVPNTAWQEKDMKYIFYMLVFLGIFLGLAEYGIYIVAEYFQISSILYAALSTALIVFFTGGIHFDGYADTIDAIFCHGNQEKRQQVLKDSNSGAFAIIYTITYFMIMFAAFENMYKSVEMYKLIFIFTLSRIFVLYLIAYTKSATEKGLLYTFSRAENKKALLIYAYLVTIFAFILLYFIVGLKSLIIILLILTSISIILNKYFIKVFGGLSGDLAGFSICIYEVCLLLYFSMFGGFI